MNKFFWAIVILAVLGFFGYKYWYKKDDEGEGKTDDNGGGGRGGGRGGVRGGGGSSEEIQDDVPLAKANKATIRAAQQTINLALNLTGSKVEKLVVDGVWGTKTANAAKSIYKKDISKMTLAQLKGEKKTA